jgi:hypothetical protein
MRTGNAGKIPVRQKIKTKHLTGIKKNSNKITVNKNYYLPSLGKEYDNNALFHIKSNSN